MDSIQNVFRFLFVLFALVSAKTNSNVVSLNSHTFNNVVDGNRFVLVKFYATWCGHCRAMAAEYNRLADYFAGRSDIIIAEIDAAEYGEFVEQFGIRGYPTLKLFTPYSHDPIELNCGRDFNSMRQYVENSMSKK